MPALISHKASFCPSLTVSQSLRCLRAFQRARHSGFSEPQRATDQFQFLVGLGFPFRPKETVGCYKIDIAEFPGEAERKICRHDRVFDSALAKKMSQNFFVGRR